VTTTDTTPAPTTTQLAADPAAATERPWVGEMVIVHRVFRKELGMLPGLVAGTADGDRRRARTLGRHYRFVTQVLHDHHTYEDDHLWPVLLERCPMDAELINRMESQHERVAALIAELPDAWQAWEYVADEFSRGRLAEKLTELSAALDEHLHDEEAFLLPIMEDHLTVAEWKAFGKHAAKKMDKTKGLFWIGLMFEDITDDEYARFWAGLPLYVRMGYQVAGPTSYRSGVARVRGH
jgi:hemerythrin-like domain-containing protein